MSDHPGGTTLSRLKEGSVFKEETESYLGGFISLC